MSGKAIPKPDDLNLKFFQKIAETGRMHVQECRRCGHHSHPPRYYCCECFSPDWRFKEIGGDGTVYSHTLSHYTAEPAWRDELPFATVVVELDEGPRIVGSARTADPASIRIGQRVRVLPERRGDDFAFFTVVFDKDGYPDV
ncbi:Zn-ribbon domain-containing OB-fold protein [Nonomuraea purpurea]|uniref:Zn-ribbon domain-containing OB-fold protein n=1 Tax=Nonomuraea purpurea TaxID=1849276 RepID=A0ABV8G1S9_9ACTN